MAGVFGGLDLRKLPGVGTRVVVYGRFASSVDWYFCLASVFDNMGDAFALVDPCGLCCWICFVPNALRGVVG